MNLTKVFLCLVALGLSTVAGRCDMLLVVDITNPGEVTLTSVDGNVSDGDDPNGIDVATVTFDGITLWGFFSGAAVLVSGALDPSSTLAATGAGSEVYDEYWAENFSTGGGAKVDLNVYTLDGENSQNFVAGDSALTGEATLDLSGVTFELLPVYGHSGAIYSGWFGNQGVQIGSYTVVPEPTTAALGLMAGGLLFFRRRRRSRVA